MHFTSLLYAQYMCGNICCLAPFLPSNGWTSRLLLLITFIIYIVLFSALEQTHCTHMWFYMSDQLFLECFWIFTEVVYLQSWRGWCHMKLLPSWRVLYTPYNYAPCHFMQSHICIHNVHRCLAVTCHLHIWQNDQDLLPSTAVTQGGGGGGGGGG